MKKDEYAGVPWPVAAKRISQAWKQLDDQGRAMYQQMAKQEINEQHEAMVEHGLRKQADGVSAEEHGGHGGVTPFDAQTVQYGRYVLLRQGEIGRGTFGRVMVAKEKTRRDVWRSRSSKMRPRRRWKFPCIRTCRVWEAIETSCPCWSMGQTPPHHSCPCRTYQG